MSRGVVDVLKGLIRTPFRERPLLLQRVVQRLYVGDVAGIQGIA